MSSDDGKKVPEDSFADKTSVVQSDTFKVRLAQADEAPPCLILLVGPANQIGRQWPIEDTDRIIGRDLSSHIFIDDRSVSKAHAKLLLKGGEVSILDLESTNKTIVNNNILRPLSPLKLKNNDQIKMGNVILKFLERGNIEAVSAAQTFDRGQKDALTGIHNRGALDLKGPEFFKRSLLMGVPLSVITFDIDHFKKINDTYGHPAGDYVLRELAQVVREHLIRENDFFARSGGEEFCLLLLGSEKERAKEIADRIRKTIESHKFEYQGQRIKVTISLGVSSISPDDNSWDHIFKRADEALYLSKTGGRNQVSVK
ncbi:MAG: GGDEF domain-containing protein [Bdellovibrio sp.]|nr:MAG: GGDEF domain-containing protein [Bdellovibrio sp.]